MTIDDLIKELQALPDRGRTIYVSESGQTLTGILGVLQKKDDPDRGLCAIVGERFQILTGGSA